MNILFGEVSGECLNICIEDGAHLFEHEGRYYDFSIDMSEDCFRICDTIGRMVPIGVHEFEDFYQAVKFARIYAKALNKRAHVIDLVEDDETIALCN